MAAPVNNTTLFLPKKRTTLTVYHGSDTDFQDFQFVGKRLTSMGLGHYFTPNKEKAAQYGSHIKKYRVSGMIFDWANPPDGFKEFIFSLLKNHVSDDVLAGYSTSKIATFEQTTEGKVLARDFFLKKKEETKNREHDRAKAKATISDDKFVITWRDADDLDNITNEMLMNLCQNYCHEIVAQLGFDGAMFSSEIVVYRKECISLLKNNFEVQGPSI